MWRVDEPRVYQVVAASAGFQRLEGPERGSFPQGYLNVAQKFRPTSADGKKVIPVRLRVIAQAESGSGPYVNLP